MANSKSDKLSDEPLLNGAKILVVDDHKNIRLSLNLILQEEGAKVTEASSVSDAGLIITKYQESPEEFPFHCILLDIGLGDGNGLDVLRTLKKYDLASKVVMISGEGTVSDAFTATKLGAFDYIEKPFTPERIIVSVERCIKYNSIEKARTALQEKVDSDKRFIGESEKFKEINEIIDRVAPTNAKVLIQGESGVGKELVAYSIFKKSKRSLKPYEKINAAAIPASLIESELFGHEKGAFTGATKLRKGVFERATTGTLFLDEIGELDLEVQAKLLRVLQNGELSRVGGEEIIDVDVRVIAATNADLEEMVEKGEFREDLLFRLNVFPISVPPLRERKDDIPLLADYFVHQTCQENAIGNRVIGDDGKKLLQQYNWPGNIRELRNVIERAVILSDTEEINEFDSIDFSKVSQKDLSRSGVNSSRENETGLEGDFSFYCGMTPWQEFHNEAGKQYILYALANSKGNVSEAARRLCLERAYLHRLMKKYDIQRDVVIN